MPFLARNIVEAIKILSVTTKQNKIWNKNNLI